MMATGCIEIAVSRAQWDDMTDKQRADFTFNALQFLVENAKRSRFRDSFMAMAGGVIGALLIWLPLAIANAKSLKGILP